MDQAIMRRLRPFENAAVIERPSVAGPQLDIVEPAGRAVDGTDILCPRASQDVDLDVDHLGSIDDADACPLVGFEFAPGQRVERQEMLRHRIAVGREDGAPVIVAGAEGPEAAIDVAQ